MDGPNQGHKLIQIHKVDELHQGSRPQSIKWMDPTRVTNLYKSTKWTDPTKGQDPSPQSGRTQRVKNFKKSTKWMDPTEGQDQSTKWTDPPRVKTIVHEVDRLGKGKKLKYPRSGWTKYQNSCPRHGRTQQGSKLKTTLWTDPTRVKPIQMNGSNEGSKSHSIGLMDTTKIKNLLQVYKVDGHC